MTFLWKNVRSDWRSLPGLIAITTIPLINHGFCTSPAALAQITPDGTLGAEASSVDPNATVRGLPAILINGGAQRGSALFQSFSDFNVGDLQRVYFANPAGVQNIFSRVTGANPSTILGTLGVNGGANLFLLNPRGILFGANARLDVAGSFTASTADQFLFEDGSQFSAANPQAPPLLDVALRPGLQWGSQLQGPIAQAGNLAVGAGQTLTLAGSTVTQTGSLLAPGGTVQLVGDRVALLGNARVDVSAVGGGGTVLIGGEFQGQGLLPRAEQVVIAPNVQIVADAIATGTGGRVIVWSDQATQFYGTISAQGGTSSGDGGFVEVSSAGNLAFSGQVDVSAPQGSLGQVLLDPQDLWIVSGSAANDPDLLDSTVAFSDGGPVDFRISNTALQGINGSVTLQASRNVIFDAPVTAPGLTNLVVDAGNQITVNQPLQLSGGNIRLTAFGAGIFLNSGITTIGGAVAFNAPNGQIALNGAGINTSLASGTGGNVTLNAGGPVALVNSIIDARSDNPSFNSFTTIRINGSSVLLDNSGISTTNINAGFAGDIFIDASNQITLTNSGIFSRGSAGRIFLGISDASELASVGTTAALPARIQISNNSSLNTNPNSNLNILDQIPGNIGIFAQDQISISNSGVLSQSDYNFLDSFSVVRILARNGSVFLDQSGISTTNIGLGFAGDVVISARDQVNVINSAIFSRGRDGRVIIGEFGRYFAFSPQSILLDGSSINTDNSSVPFNNFLVNVGDVFIRANGPISLLNGSQIFNNTQRLGNAGNVTIITFSDLTLVNSDVFSNVGSTGIGNGGTINMFARSLFLLNGSQLQTRVQTPVPGLNPGQPDAGTINIYVADSLKVMGRNALGQPSGIFSTVDEGSLGNSGDIWIQGLSSNQPRVRSVQVRDGGIIDVNNLGFGRAGNIILRARGLWLDNRGLITASSLIGGGGNILLDVNGAVIMGRNSRIQTSRVFNFASFGLPSSPSLERAGNIAIGTGALLLDDLGPDGTITPRFSNRTLLIAGKTYRDNNIASIGFDANGGRIQISTFRLQDIAQRPDSALTNDITTQSFLRVDGDVVISTLDIFPSLRTDPLPEQFVPPRISQGCDPRIRQETSQFTITGRGGLPPNPSDVLTPDTLAGLESRERTSQLAPTPTAGPVPAQGWVKGADGALRLVGNSPDGSFPSQPYPGLPVSTSCAPI